MGRDLGYLWRTDVLFEGKVFFLNKYDYGHNNQQAIQNFLIQYRKLKFKINFCWKVHRYV